MIDIILSFLLMKNEVDSDGYLEIGFPFTVLRKTNGKMFNGTQGGFIWSGLLLNLLIIFAISLGFFYIYKKIFRPSKANRKDIGS